jgi:hypothetical protein
VIERRGQVHFGSSSPSSLHRPAEAEAVPSLGGPADAPAFFRIPRDWFEYQPQERIKRAPFGGMCCVNSSRKSSGERI